jgi:hypothetical protein
VRGSEATRPMTRWGRGTVPERQVKETSIGRCVGDGDKEEIHILNRFLWC